MSCTLRTCPNVVEAERAEDPQAYYLALRDYIYSIPDGHLGIDSSWHDAARRGRDGWRLWLQRS